MPKIQRSSLQKIHSSFQAASSGWERLPPSSLLQYCFRYGIYHTLIMGMHEESRTLLGDYRYRFYRLDLLNQEIEFLLKDMLSVLSLNVDTDTQGLFLEMKSFQHLLSMGTDDWSAGLIYLQLTSERTSGQEKEAERCAQEQQRSLFSNVDKKEGVAAFPIFSNVVVMGQKIRFSCFVDDEVVLLLCHHSREQNSVILWSLNSSSILYSTLVPFGYLFRGIQNHHFVFQENHREIQEPILSEIIFPDVLYQKPAEEMMPEDVVTLIKKSHTESRGESLIKRRMKNYRVDDFWLNTDCDGAIRIVHHGKELRIIVLGDLDTKFMDYNEGKIIFSVRSQPNQVYVVQCAEFMRLKPNCYWEFQNGHLYPNRSMDIIKEGLFILSAEQFITTTWQGFYNNGELLVLELFELYDDGTFECINEAEESIFYPLSGVALRENGWVSIYGESGHERVWWDKEDEVMLDPAHAFASLPPIVASEMKYMEGCDAVANFAVTSLRCTIEDNFVMIVDTSTSKVYRWFFDRKPSFAEPIRDDSVIILQSDSISVLTL